VKTALAIGICLLAALPARAQTYPTIGSQLNPAAFGSSGVASVTAPASAPSACPYAQAAPSGGTPPQSLNAPQFSTAAPPGAAFVAGLGPGQVHPAVARIVAPGNGSVSYGSGTLVHVGPSYGIVITNWHVINEATGPVSVHFPDGFYSLGTVQNVDRDWDLAAIAIRPPQNIQPVPMANQPPRPGEILTIAGYGSGTYRAASGPCTQYVAPGLEFPYEMVEVAVSARQGDSGGPIFNSRGELAGVLFGEGHGRTSGSYCGRVRWFLTSVVPPTPPAQAIADMRPLAPVPERPANLTASLQDTRPLSAVATEPAPATTPPTNATAASLASSSPPAASPPAPPVSQAAPLVASVGAEPITATEAIHLGWQDIAGETWGDQIKTVLAGIGLLQALRWLGRQDAAAG
jgi:hypothetical protein